MKLSPRLWAMLAGWGSIVLIYVLGSFSPFEPIPIAISSIDRQIAFNPLAIYGYVSFYVFVALTYWVIPIERLSWLTQTMQVTAVTIGLVFFWIPTMVEIPVLTPESPWLLRFVQQIDTPLNCFPSLHITLTLFCAWGLQSHRSFGIRWGSIGWSLWIMFSVLQLKRHLWLDVLGGIITAGVVIAWLYCLDVKGGKPIVKRV